MEANTENILLARLLFDNDEFIQVHDEILPNFFKVQENKDIYVAMSMLLKSGKEIDYISLTDVLPNYSVAIAELLSLDAYSMSTNNALESIKEKYKIEELKVLGSALSFPNPNKDAEFMIDYINTEVSRLSGSKKVDIVDFKDRINTLMQQMDDNASGESAHSGVDTGFSQYDAFSRGLHYGDLVVIAGESSQGKTSLAVSMAFNMSAKNKVPVLFYSLEMTSNQLTARYTANVTHTSSKIVLYDNIPQTALNSVKRDMMSIKDSPFYIDNSGNSQYKNILNTIRRYVLTKGVKVVVIDYLQLANNEKKGQNKETEIGDMSRGFKNLALELNIVIIELSQLSRNKENPIPSMSRLRQSGQIEESADVVLLVYRPSYYGREYEVDGVQVGREQGALIQGKGRNTGIGQFILNFNQDLTMWGDVENRIYNNDYDPNNRIESNNAAF